MALSKQLQAKQVDLVVLDQGIDTSTTVGRMFFQILGAIAEFEHALMSERTRDGLDAARARGRTGEQNPSSRRVKRRSRRTCTTSSDLTAAVRTPSNRSPTSSASHAPRSTATCSAKPTDGYMAVGAAFLNGTLMSASRSAAVRGCLSRTPCSRFARRRWCSWRALAPAAPVSSSGGSDGLTSDATAPWSVSLSSSGLAGPTTTNDVGISEVRDLGSAKPGGSDDARPGGAWGRGLHMVVELSDFTTIRGDARLPISCARRL